ncbi:gamma-secretase-activating protein [Anaeramoeba ignava]|uniref:Gamma-secretase-activating protein n=1 Tax=Anaeramoeba ignava TaxID=1746090 RepID=A0A9Q0LGW0_ANAIG|nr:gamma-secretase-activating protein [Anaeramoeba ignava]
MIKFNLISQLSQFQSQNIQTKVSPNLSNKLLINLNLNSNSNSILNNDIDMNEFHNPENIPQKDIFIGQNNNKILIAKQKTIDNKIKTLIDIFDIEKNVRENLYIHPTSIHCVGASINNNFKTLIFTSRIQRLETTEGHFVAQENNYYQTYLIDLRNPENIFIILPPTQEYQAVFFENEKQIIVILDGKFIRRYNISDQKIILKKNIANSVYWYQFDPISQVLYFITKISASSQETCLWFYSFKQHNKKYFAIPFVVSYLESLRKIYDHQSFSSNLVSPNSNLRISLVKIDPIPSEKQYFQQEICLCQHLTIELMNQNLKERRIRIISLYRKEEIIVSIPLKNLSSKFIMKSNTFITSLFGYLIILIPNIYLSFIDFGRSHLTMESMSFFLNDFVPHFSLVEDNLEESITLYLLKTSLQTEYFGFDIGNFELFSFEFDLSKFPLLFSLLPSDSVVKFAIHAITSHFESDNLVEEIIENICSMNISAFTSAFFQELVVGLTYGEMKKIEMKKIGKYKKVLLSTIPKSSIPGFRLYGNELVPKSYIPRMTKGKIEYSNFSLNLMEETGSFFFFQVINSGKDVKNAENDNISGVLTVKEKEDLLAKHILNHLPKNRIVNSFVEMYSKEEENSTKRVFNILKKLLIPSTVFQNENFLFTENEDEKVKLKQAFKVMKNFYSFLEEMSIPYPHFFQDLFCYLGYTSLSKNLFFRYIDNRVIIITFDFIEVLMKNNKEDPQYILYLASYLEHEKEFISVSEYFPECWKNLIEFYSSKFSSKLKSSVFSKQTSNVHRFQKSQQNQFLPFDFIVQKLNENITDDAKHVKFFCDHAVDFYAQNLFD